MRLRRKDKFKIILALLVTAFLLGVWAGPYFVYPGN